MIGSARRLRRDLELGSAPSQSDLKIPVFIFQGEYDFNTLAATARKYFDDITAPKKAFAIIPGASHNTLPFHDELLRL